MSDVPPPPPPPPVGPPPGYQPFGGGHTQPTANRKAVTAMVLGIVGLFCVPFILSLVALVLGVQARSEIDRSGGAYSNRGMATAGIVTGLIGLAFGVLFVVRLAVNN